MKRTLFIVGIILLLIVSCSPLYKFSGYDNGVRTFITFDKNSSELNEEELLRLNEFVLDVPAGWKIYIKGSADTKNENNCEKLAFERCLSVKQLLIFKHDADPTLIEDIIELNCSESELFSRSVILTISKK